jgi:hypothetical protein
LGHILGIFSANTSVRPESDLNHLPPWRTSSFGLNFKITQLRTMV